MAYRYSFFMPTCSDTCEALTHLRRMVSDDKLRNGMNKDFIQGLIYDLEDNETLCLFHYKLAIEQKDNHAMVNYFLYFVGRDQIFDHGEAVTYLKVAAIELNCARAKNNLANYYCDNDNIEAARTLYLQSLSAGYMSAIVNLAELLEFTDNNYQEAIKYYLLAIEKNISKDYYKVAECYRQLDDHESAVKYFKLSLDSGNKNAAFELGLYYGYVVQDYNLAIDYYLMSEETGNSLYNAALLYENKLNDIDNAIKCYNLAIDKGNVPSMINLGNIYYKRTDVDLTKKYFQMAIDNDYIPAWSCMGSYYLENEKDNKTSCDIAIRYFQYVIDNVDKLYDSGESDDRKAYSISLHNMGVCHGIKNNHELAIKYYMMAIRENQIESVNCLFTSLNNTSYDTKYIDELITILQLQTINVEVKSVIYRKLVRYINVSTCVQQVLTLVSLPSINSHDRNFLMLSLRQAQPIIGQQTQWFNSFMIKVKHHSDQRLAINKECPICLDDETTNGIVLLCGHSYCESCITVYCESNHYCPLCKRFVY